MNQPNFYAVIPATVRYCEHLIPTAKLLYGEITALSNERGYCWAGNSHFARLYNVSDFTVSRWISQLEKHGFVRVQIDKEAGNQRLIYINDAVPLLRKSAIGIDEKRNTLLRKSARGIDEKRKQNNTMNNKENNTVNSASRAQNQPYVENQKKEKPPQVPARPPTYAEASAGNPAITFAASIWSSATTGAFATALHHYYPETADADAGYYLARCRDWSAQHPDKRKADWLAFAAQIIVDDRYKQKLVTFQPSSGHASNSNYSAFGKPEGTLLDQDNIVERAAGIAERLRRKHPCRYQ
jgi:hypothetical protein